MPGVWSKIVVNAVSTFVAALLLGAGAILWNKAMSIDSEVETAKTMVLKQVDYNKELVAVLQKELLDVREMHQQQVIELQQQIDRLIEAIEKGELKTGDSGKMGTFKEPSRPTHLKSVPAEDFLEQRLPQMPDWNNERFNNMMRQSR